jgi:transcriptional regulator with XRE-family HTH domain
MPVNEKTAFAERLRSALKRAPKSIKTASQLAHEFNLRHAGEPITPQSGQKWLTGKARPSPDKLETLAEMLGVSSYWLKNGSPPPATKKAVAKKSVQAPVPGQLTNVESKLIARLRTLSEHQVSLVFELVEQLAIERELAGHS